MSVSITHQLRKFRIYQKRNLKYDFVAAIVVFLVAVPLCLGIALASGTPLFSGIISGIIGGIVVGAISGSHVSVSGPAAGMAAVVLAAMTQLQNFNILLLAVVLAGIIQIIIGSLRAGFIADYVPSNVVQGLLCAIGVLLIIKQLPLAFTLSSDFTELKAHLLETTEGFTVQPLLGIKEHINEGASLISLLSIGLLVFFDKTKISWLKSIPGPIVVVIFGVVLNESFIYFGSFMAQNGAHLVNIPTNSGARDFLKQLQFPDWSAWSNPNVYLYGFMFAIVASLESLLNVKAGEKLDRQKRTASKDREMIAQGVGNLTAGLIGGIPITSVVVRTSVNIQSGSKSKMSAIFHGFFILIAVLLLPTLLNKIPLSTLAAILIHTGYKLTHPAIYRNIYKQGLDRFTPFVITVVSIVIFNLLTGILIGLGFSLFYILKYNSQARLDLIQEVYPNGISYRLVLPQQISFLNKASLVAELDSIPKRAQLVIDAHQAQYIDKEIVEYIKEFQKEKAPPRQISLNLVGFKDHYDIHNYIDFINVTTYDVQSMLSPHHVLNLLVEGNQRFMNDTRIHRNFKADIKYTSHTQHPLAIVLGCIDSRVPVETIFDMSFGDLFCVRVAGNVVNNDVLASIEYGCHVAGAKLIVVLGHTRCGAIQSACDHVKTGHITELLAKITPAIDAESQTTSDRTSNNEQFVKNVTELNIALTLLGIYQSSEILKNLISQEEVGLIGAIYDVSDGHVCFKDFSSKVIALDKQKDKDLPDKLQKLMHDTDIDVDAHCANSH